MKTLQCRHLTFQVNGKTLLADANLTLTPGKLVGLVGPNGAGKTTLLRLLVGLESPTAGEVQWDDRDIVKMGAEERARLIAWLGTKETPVFSFRVDEVVAMGRFATHGGAPGVADRQAVDEALTRVGMLEFRDRDITTLSDGERQKVRLARCLAAQTPILLCDEPLGALDLQARINVLRELRRKAEEGAIVCLSIHDLNLAMQACDELVCIDQGRVVKTGTPEEVLNQDSLTRIFHSHARLEHTPSGHKAITFFLPRDDV